MYKFSFYVPIDHLEPIKTALFKAGAGRLSNYDCCAWQTLGTGQYRPLSSSQPYVGTHDRIEIVEEYLVEMVCEDQYIQNVVKELLRVHPYEIPSYAVWKIDLCMKRNKEGDSN
ncbi:NGG1p interacting factor NIF3 [Coxiella endosymbiont of Amblyomma sculptum]|uniref:NGG1p interacting factor NIF3 n=1 Tax=Coxiella endosymbiont of Amblyomma sculptum TaxID=2487929 RepID=UPI00132EFA65|nr:NGG1p interacting factor NIF3 [Coxiella endosymbiont of Amblyomma sculptum]QHG92746.1 NGG1p interacting factor NIF3 [Coxiella endosymbiont of Amblyomma sculptum]